MKLAEQDKNLIERIFDIDTEIYVPTFSFVYRDSEGNCENTLSNVLGDNANIVTKKYSISNDAVLLIVENEDTDNGYTCICIKGKKLDLEPKEIIKNMSITPVYAVYSTYMEDDKYKICLTNTTSEEGTKIENKMIELDNLFINNKLDRDLIEMENCFINIYNNLDGTNEALFIYFKDINDGEDNE